MTERTETQVPSVLVRGNTLAAWSAAAMLSAELSGAARIEICTGTSDPEPAIIPETVSFDGESVLLSYCGHSAADLLKMADGGFLLGSRFAAWGPSGSDVYQASGEALPNEDGVALHQIVLRAAFEQGAPDLFAGLYAPLMFQARTAAAGRMATPAEDRRSPRSLLRPAITLDAANFTALMRKRALANGVVEVETSESAWLTIDAREPQSGQTGWANRVGLDFGTAISVLVTPKNGRMLAHDPVDTVRADGGELLHCAPLQSGIVATLFGTKEPERIAALLPDYDIGPTTVRDIAWGWDDKVWEGSTIRIGGSAGNLGPIMHSDTALLSVQLETLLGLLPPLDSADTCHHAREYNRIVSAKSGHLHDLLMLPFARNALPEERWQTLRSRPLSPNLTRRLREFERRGTLVLLDDDIAEKQVWLELMIGLGITPARYDRAADGVDIQRRMGSLGHMVRAFDQTIAAMPAHDEFLAQALGQVTQ